MWDTLSGHTALLRPAALFATSALNADDAADEHFVLVEQPPAARPSNENSAARDAAGDFSDHLAAIVSSGRDRVR
ncbi:hypothetical protein HK405_015784, partial [Cladochytrium tenue]